MTSSSSLNRFWNSFTVIPVAIKFSLFANDEDEYKTFRRTIRCRRQHLPSPPHFSPSARPSVRLAGVALELLLGPHPTRSAPRSRKLADLVAVRAPFAEPRQTEEVSFVRQRGRGGRRRAFFNSALERARPRISRSAHR